MNDQAQDNPPLAATRLDETHGCVEIAVMIDEEGGIVFGAPDDDLGELYEDQVGTTDQSKERSIVTLWLPKAKTKTATAVVPQGATSEVKVVIQA